MKTLDDISQQGRRTGMFVGRAAQYEWHAFIDGLAHSYRTAQINSDWPPMLTPRCEERQQFPLRHDRESVTGHMVRPIPGRICIVCDHCVHVANQNQEASRAQA